MTDKTDREIMQQALEALNYISRRDYDDTPLHDYELAKMRPAMSALRERLAQPEPERREWQGLTDEEISAISKSIPGETDLGAAKRLFAREIEAKLKEKNT